MQITIDMNMNNINDLLITEKEPMTENRLGLSFANTIRSRTSCRAFLPTPVSNEVITSVLEDAQLSPSNCNSQPWITHIVSGAKLAQLSQAILKANTESSFTPDFSFDQNCFYGEYAERSMAQGKAYYQGLGVAREDVASRQTAVDLNYTFFNAPQVALLFMPSFGDNVRVAGDIGMYGQSFLLSLTDHGLAGVPQTSLGFFAATIRETLGISDDQKLLFGISFGYADKNAPGSRIEISRVPISDSVTFHS